MKALDKKITNILKYIVLFALAIVLVYFAFRKVEWSAFLDGLKQTRWFWVVLFCIASVTALVLRTIRWRELLSPFDNTLSFIQIWDAINIGNLASTALPGSGELLRCGLVVSKRLEYDKSLGTMLCERLWDFLALVVLAIIAMVFGWNRFGTYFEDNIFHPLTSNTGFWWILAIVVVAVTAFIVTVFQLKSRSVICGKIADSISRLWSGFTVFSKSKNKLLIALTTLLLWTVYVIMCYCIIKAMPMLQGLDFIDALFFSMMGNFASIIPVPGGIGAYHYLVAAAVGVYGYSWEIGILYATLNHEIHAVLIIIVGLVAYLHTISVRRSRSTDVN